MSLIEKALHALRRAGVQGYRCGGELYLAPRAAVTPALCAIVDVCRRSLRDPGYLPSLTAGELKGADAVIVRDGAFQAHRLRESATPRPKQPRPVPLEAIPLAVVVRRSARAPLKASHPEVARLRALSVQLDSAIGRRLAEAERQSISRSLRAAVRRLKVMPRSW